MSKEEMEKENKISDTLAFTKSQWSIIEMALIKIGDEFLKLASLTNQQQMTDDYNYVYRWVKNVTRTR